MQKSFSNRKFICVQTGGKSRIACLRVERHVANCASATQPGGMFIPPALIFELRMRLLQYAITTQDRENQNVRKYSRNVK